MQRAQLEKIRSMPPEEVKATLIDFLTEFPSASVPALLEAITKIEVPVPQTKAEIAAEMITLIVRNQGKEFDLMELSALMGFKDITNTVRSVYWTLLDFHIIERMVSKKMGTGIGKKLPQELIDLIMKPNTDTTHLLTTYSAIVELL